MGVIQIRHIYLLLAWHIVVLFQLWLTEVVLHLSGWRSFKCTSGALVVRRSVRLRLGCIHLWYIRILLVLESYAVRYRLICHRLSLNCLRFNRRRLGSPWRQLRRLLRVQKLCLELLFKLSVALFLPLLHDKGLAATCLLLKLN